MHGSDGSVGTMNLVADYVYLRQTSLEVTNPSAVYASVLQL